MTDSIHTAVCQAVTIMNTTPGMYGTQPHNILREALMNYSEPASTPPAEPKDDYSWASLFYDIRVAVGDPQGKLMQDELVERIRAKFAEPQSVK